MLAEPALAAPRVAPAGVLELNPGEASVAHSHGGDEVVYALEGVLHVRAFGDEGNSVFELNPDDAAYIHGQTIVVDGGMVTGRSG